MSPRRTLSNDAASAQRAHNPDGAVKPSYSELETELVSVVAERERLREALSRVERVYEGAPGMPRPRDAQRDRVLEIVRSALTQDGSTG